MNGCKIIICTAEIESLVMIEDTDISGNFISKPITTFFNKYL